MVQEVTRLSMMSKLLLLNSFFYLISFLYTNMEWSDIIKCYLQGINCFRLFEIFKSVFVG